MKKLKIAIVGGGVGGLAAAFDLTSTAERRERFAVTVHQMGWRLGGKCATGRNADHGDRIEEHGIHGFLGSYFNALTLMKKVYAEWQPPADSPLATFEKAFPREFGAFFWEWEGDALVRWRSDRPYSHGAIEDAPKFATLRSWLAVTAQSVKRLAMAVGPADPEPGTPETRTALLAEFDKIIASVAPPAADPKTDAAAVVDWSGIADVLALTRRAAELERFERRTTLLLEFLKVLTRGVRDDDLLKRGLRAVDDEDFLDWLARHGASEDLLASPLVLSTINTTYQFPDGDLTRRPAMSATSYLMWTFRSFVQLEAPYHLFAAGSGDTIVAPLYQVLKKRGVRFEFFHRLRDAHLDEAGGSLESLLFERQAAPKGDYRPLRRVKNVDCWPNRPDLDQLERGRELDGFDFEAPWETSPHAHSVVLVKGEDFDHAIFAMPPKALAVSAPSLCARAEKWARAARDIPAIATQAAQVWFDKPIKEMDADPDVFHLAGNFVTGLHGHVDFGKFLAFEDWCAEREPKGLMYMSGVHPTDDAPLDGEREAALTAQVKESAITFFAMGGGRVLPKAAMIDAGPGGHPFSLDFDALSSAAPKGSGRARFDDQYWRVNIRPSERYTQSPAGTIRARLDPFDTGVDNLTGAGDWVDAVLNVGSFEGAVMGGMLAARAIDPTLPFEDVIGAAPTPADKPPKAP